MADYIFLLQYFTDDTGVCSHVCAPVLWRNSYPPPPETVHQCWKKSTPFDAQLTRFYIRVIRVRDVKWSAWQQLNYLRWISQSVSPLITLSLAGRSDQKNVPLNRCTPESETARLIFLIINHGGNLLGNLFMFPLLLKESISIVAINSKKSTGHVIKLFKC